MTASQTLTLLCVDVLLCRREVRVLEADRTHVNVHYCGWTSKWNEWIHWTSDRLSLLHTKTANWRDLMVNDKVQVGCVMPQRSIPK